MFYLKNFFVTLGHLKTRGVVLMLLTIVSFTIVLSGSQLEKMMSRYTKVSENLPYFNLLMDEQISAADLQRKLMDLPGVVKVEIKDKKALRQKIQQRIKKISADVPNSLKALEYNAFKVSLVPSITKRNYNLIYEYVERVSGNNKVSISPIKRIKGATRSNKIGLFLKQHLHNILLFVAFMVWAIGVLFATDKLKYHSFLIEKFQRRKNVLWKSLWVGTSFFAAVSYLVYINVIGKFELSIITRFSIIYILMLGLILLISEIGKKTTK
jgi:hypothetical protein